MPDYTKCCIYKLCCKDPMIEDCYIGSTTNVIKRRQNHKKSCTNPNDKEYNTYKYQFIREKGEWLNWNLVVIEEFSCENKFQKEKMERYYIEELKPTLNKAVPVKYQTGDVYNKKEYDHMYFKGRYEANKDIMNEKGREYYKNNKNKIKEKVCKPYTCECGRTIRYGDKATHFKTKVHQDYISSSPSSSSSKEEV